MRVLLLLFCIGLVQSCGVTAAEPNQSADANSIDAILCSLNNATSSLKSYQCQIEYRFSQPILESQSIRTGEMYYQKSGKRSNLRINFLTLKQDEEKPQQYIGQYFFDSVLLTVIDYQIKEVKRYELADANNPADALELAANNFPIIGFGSTQDLKEDFEISLLPRQPDKEYLIGLHLKVKSDSRFKDKYSSVDFWIDRKLNLPAKIITNSTEGDIYEINLIQPQVNKPIDKKIFELKIPKGFGKPEIIPMEKGDRK